MKLTLEQENDLLIRYEPFLKRRVQNYIQDTQRHAVDFEDYLQEARLAFLEHIRKMDSMEELCLCYYDILHAMHAQFRNMAPLHFAANSFSKARKDYSVIPLESAEDMEDPVSFEEQVEYRLLAEEFMNSLSQKDRQILDVKMKGIRGKDAARAAGVGSEACVSRHFSGIRQAYYRQVKGVSANA